MENRKNVEEMMIISYEDRKFPQVDTILLTNGCVRDTFLKR